MGGCWEPGHVGSFCAMGGEWQVCDSGVKGWGGAQASRFPEHPCRSSPCHHLAGNPGVRVWLWEGVGEYKVPTMWPGGRCLCPGPDAVCLSMRPPWAPVPASAFCWSWEPRPGELRTPGVLGGAESRGEPAGEGPRGPGC